eukprot:TRINITY_DN18583_c0_g1_i1.p1 TRINITY_DN18583_c0_g1~~TRINITY_DN18583_c0_g1_i1.p1  ORF type:complete len:1139 (-),score=156.53 TRINITY_DN18583_c0_g1_i1:189-3101(-)
MIRIQAIRNSQSKLFVPACDVVSKVRPWHGDQHTASAVIEFVVDVTDLCEGTNFNSIEGVISPRKPFKSGIPSNGELKKAAESLSELMSNVNMRELASRMRSNFAKACQQPKQNFPQSQQDFQQSQQDFQQSKPDLRAFRGVCKRWELHQRGQAARDEAARNAERGARHPNNMQQSFEAQTNEMFTNAAPSDRPHHSESYNNFEGVTNNSAPSNSPKDNHLHTNFEAPTNDCFTNGASSNIPYNATSTSKRQDRSRDCSPQETSCPSVEQALNVLRHATLELQEVGACPIQVETLPDESPPKRSPMWVEACDGLLWQRESWRLSEQVLLLLRKSHPKFDTLPLNDEELIDSIEELLIDFEFQNVWRDPKAFMYECFEDLWPLVIRNIAKQIVDKWDGVTWEDVRPIFEEIDTLDEVQRFILQPKLFIEKMCDWGGPVARKCIVLHLRFELCEPRSRLVNLIECMVGTRFSFVVDWEDLEAVLREVDTVDELREIIHDPKGFLQRLTAVTTPAARRFMLLLIRSRVEPHIRCFGSNSQCQWRDVANAVASNNDHWDKLQLLSGWMPEVPAKDRDLEGLSKELIDAYREEITHEVELRKRREKFVATAETLYRDAPSTDVIRWEDVKRVLNDPRVPVPEEIDYGSTPSFLKCVDDALRDSWTEQLRSAVPRYVPAKQQKKVQTYLQESATLVQLRKGLDNPRALFKRLLRDDRSRAKMPQVTDSQQDPRKKYLLTGSLQVTFFGLILAMLWSTPTLALDNERYVNFMLAIPIMVFNVSQVSGLLYQQVKYWVFVITRGDELVTRVDGDAGTRPLFPNWGEPATMCGIWLRFLTSMIIGFGKVMVLILLPLVLSSSGSIQEFFTTAVATTVSTQADSVSDAPENEHIDHEVLEKRSDTLEEHHKALERRLAAEEHAREELQQHLDHVQHSHEMMAHILNADAMQGSHLESGWFGLHMVRDGPRPRRYWQRLWR